MLDLDIGHTVVSQSDVPRPSGEITEEPTLAGESDPRTPSRAGAGEATRISNAGPDATEDKMLATAGHGGTHTPVTASGKTPPAQKKSGAYPTDNAEDLTGQTLNGLFVKKKLGAGGMGSVFLARQISLDRDVAVKVLPGQLAARPDFLARFTREALSAARLNHHNVIQVYDVGSLQNVHYITMEFVQGASLGDLIRKEGKLDVETAAGYVLQAARGLHYAHRRGIIHRDIKPDNLMVNEHGVVKVADLGLAKMAGIADPESDPKDETLIHEAIDSLTMVGTAMGTPSYMAPEQGKDASKVDHRADQYSLGCTLYYLCAGKTPFTGRTTFEIISKHATEPLVPLDAHVRNVPKQLSIIIERMLAKNAEDRYPSLAEVIRDIEAFLGVEADKGPYTPREEHMQLLEKQQKAFYQAPSQRKRQLATTGFFVGGAVLFLLAFFAISFVAAGAVLGILVLTPLINFIIDGARNKRYLFRRVRSVFFGMTWKGWSATAMWAVLALLILYTMGLLLAWIAVAFLAAGLAFAYQAMIVRKLEREREPQLHLVQEMLKILRVRGVSEEAIQDFVCRFTGENWEEFFEALFGYESMLYFRERTSSRDKVKPRKRHATWRDPLARWLTEVEQKRRRAKEEAQIRKAESARLRSEGKSDADAEKEAKALAKEAAEDLGATLIIQPVETTPSKAEIAVADRDLYRSSKKDKQSHGMVFWGFRLGRLAFALGILGAYALSPASRIPLGMQLPGFVESMLNAWYNCGAGGSDYALVAGALLLVSVFSSRVLMPLLMTIGAFLMMTYNPLVNIVEAPNFDAARAFWGGLLACVVGFVGLVFGKLGGGRF